MEFILSQKQVVIKLIHKKVRHEIFIKNWQSDFSKHWLQSSVYHFVLKSTSFVIRHQQTAYIQNRFISETGRLISEILEVTANSS